MTGLTAGDLLPVAALGFALAASPGPVNALAVVRGLRHGASQTFYLAAGAGSADALYAALVIIGVGPFVRERAVQIVLALGGGLFLVRLGLLNLRATGRIAGTDGDAAVGSDPSGWAAFRDGFSVALLSPLTIVFWMSVFGGYYADRVAHGFRASPVVLLAVLLLGANLWTCLFALIIHLGRRVLAGKVYRVLVSFLSVVLLGFGARLLWTGIRLLLPA